MGRPEFHRLADRDLNEAAQNYDLEKPGLGSSFLREVDRCYDQLRSIPKPGSFFVVLFVVASSDDFPMHFSIRQARQHSDPGGHESQAAPDVLGGSRVTPPNIRT